MTSLLDSIPNQKEHRFRYFRRLVTLGILSILLGIFSLSVPVVTSIGLSWLLGIVLLASGISQLIHFFQAIHEPGKLSRFFLCILSFVAGALVLRNPVSGMVAMTMVLSFYFLLAGVGRGFLAADIYPHQGWGWLALSSAVSVFIGVVLMVWLPINSLIAPAVFFGVDLITFGGALIAFSRVMKRVEKGKVGIEKKVA